MCVMRYGTMVAILVRFVFETVLMRVLLYGMHNNRANAIILNTEARFSRPIKASLKQVGVRPSTLLAHFLPSH